MNTRIVPVLAFVIAFIIFFGLGEILMRLYTASVTYYVQRASQGLIITEASQVAPEAAGYPRTPGIYSDTQVAAWREITRAVHERGARIFLQLWHAGRISHPSVLPGGQLPVAPSAIRAEGTLMTPTGTQPYVTPRALDVTEIPGIVAQFRRAARHAVEAGFDGVELHGANGYLLDQFLRDGSNRRSDGYGGSIANRARLLLEVTDAVVEEWGAQRVGVHVSPLVDVHSVSDTDPERLFIYVTEELARRKIAYLHVFESVIPHPATPSRRFDLRVLRRAFVGTYIANGGYGLERATAAITAGDADLVSFGRPYISNPDLPERLRLGVELAPADAGLFYQGEARGYIDYPSMADAGDAAAAKGGACNVETTR